jgi:hypothetical protein
MAREAVLENLWSEAPCISFCSIADSIFRFYEFISLPVQLLQYGSKKYRVLPVRLAIYSTSRRPWKWSQDKSRIGLRFLSVEGV